VSDSIRKNGHAASDVLWGLIIAVWLMSVILFGGTGFPARLVQYYVALSSLSLIIIGLWRLRKGLPSKSAVFACVLAALSFGLVLAQLVPLPFDFWRTLPGRDAMVKALESVNGIPSTLPFSLSATETREAAFNLLPSLAAFVAVMSVRRRMFWTISAAICTAAFVGAVIGLMQKGLGAASGLFFYGQSATNLFATGTFANRNFFATQLFTALPFLAALAMTLSARLQLRTVVTYLFMLVFTGILVAVLAAVGSRAGLFLGMLSVLLTFGLVFRPAAGRSGIRLGKGVVFSVIALVVMAQASMLGFLRLAESDPLSDFRGTIAAVGVEAAKAQFPYGSGFGTFVPVYQLYETPETIIDGYVNHAHNDWLELAIEGGAPAMALMGLFLVWLVYGLFQALRLPANDEGNAHIRAAGIAMVLLLLHAIVDFPFRTDAHLTLFGLYAGFLAFAAVRFVPERRRVTQSPKNVTVSNPTKNRGFTPARKPFAPRQPVFDQPSPPETSEERS
jgi:hypothetical protein